MRYVLWIVWLVALIAMFNAVDNGGPQDSILFVYVFIWAALPVYLLPTIIASHRHHVYWLPILVLNVLLGLSGVVWVICLVWAVMPGMRNESLETTSRRTS